MSRYINPYTDFGFKKLFGEEANKDLLIDFLNELLPDYHKITELTFKNVEQLPDLPVERKAVFNIYCTAQNVEHFLVEMQKAKINFFKDRALFYSTFPIRSQAKPGNWDFRLETVYMIAILDFPYDAAQERQKFLRHVQLKDQDCEIFYDKLHYKFIQMPLFTKTEAELVTHFDKWIYFLKNLSSFDEIPAFLKEPIFEKAFSVSEIANFSPAQRDQYEQNWLNYLGVKAMIDTAKMDGVIEGESKGKIAGKIELILKSIKRGKLTIEEIAEEYEVAVTYVLELKRENNL